MTIEMTRTETTTTLLTVTPEAVEQLHAVFAEENNPNLALRVFLNGNRAAMTLDDAEREDDVVMSFGGLKVLVDIDSAPYLEGAIIGYSDTLMERGFTIENANLPVSESGGGCCGGSCGCN